MNNDVPRREYRLVLDLEADSYDELWHALDNISLELSREPVPDGAERTSGGYASGYHMELSHNAGQTAEGFRRELTAWIGARREARDAARSSSGVPL